jgi:hypothetical protein
MSVPVEVPVALRQLRTVLLGEPLHQLVRKPSRRRRRCVAKMVEGFITNARPIPGGLRRGSGRLGYLTAAVSRSIVVPRRFQ